MSHPHNALRRSKVDHRRTGVIASRVAWTNIESIKAIVRWKTLSVSANYVKKRVSTFRSCRSKNWARENRNGSTSGRRGKTTLVIKVWGWREEENMFFSFRIFNQLNNKPQLKRRTIHSPISTTRKCSRWWRRPANKCSNRKCFMFHLRNGCQVVRTTIIVEVNRIIKALITKHEWRIFSEASWVKLRFCEWRFCFIQAV